MNVQQLWGDALVSIASFLRHVVAAVIVLRRKNPAAERPYRTWGYPIVPIISIALAAIVILDLAYLAPSTSGIGILIVLTGVPVYFLWRQQAASSR